MTCCATVSSLTRKSTFWRSTHPPSGRRLASIPSNEHYSQSKGGLVPPTATAATSLDRRLGPLDAAVIVIGNVIGVGIFTTPGVIASMLPNSAAMLGVWAVGGLLAFAGALAYAELAARRPQAGGEYVYLRESFGRLAAFLTGWTSFVAGFSGAIAAGAVGATAYLDRL